MISVVITIHSVVVLIITNYIAPYITVVNEIVDFTLTINSVVVLIVIDLLDQLTNYYVPYATVVSKIIDHYLFKSYSICVPDKFVPRFIVILYKSKTKCLFDQ